MGSAIHQRIEEDAYECISWSPEPEYDGYCYSYGVPTIKKF